MQLQVIGRMYGVLAQLPSHFFSCLNFSPGERRRMLWESSRLWINGKQQYVITTNPIRFIDHTDAFRKGNYNFQKLPRVSGRNAELEYEKSRMEDWICEIKKMLQSIDDSRISVFPYDTAWIALIKNVSNDIDSPQFPTTLDWIANNQLPDGSWGDQTLFLPTHRLLNTLACVLALKTWNVCPNKIQKGILFVKENITKLEDVTKNDHMTCGFELLFAALLQRCRNLGIQDLPYDAPVARKIFDAKGQMLERISKEGFSGSLVMMLEGLENLEWEKVLKLQSPDGSFLSSPSATAFAFMHTRDENCLRFITKIVQKFNAGPNTYPVNISARLWAVDRLERLGVSRFFDSETDQFLSYIYRFWTEKGVLSGRDSEFCDINDTSMGFRLLRLHGYNVNLNVFNKSNKDDKFSVYVDEMVDSPSAMFNLYRASQLHFPGEALLQTAMDFSYSYLQQSTQLLEECLISKHLLNEIKCGLEMPWYGSLPRVEARFFMENYSMDQVWIGKSLYRMHDINDIAYLELAKLDFNRCQKQHQIEWNHMQQWYEDHNVEEFGISKKEVLVVYFLAAATIFEPERSQERLAWVKSSIVYTILSAYYFIKESEPSDQSTEYFYFTALGIKVRIDPLGYTNMQRIITVLFETLDQFKKGAKECVVSDIGDDLLHEAWGGWLKKKGERRVEGEEVEVVIRIINICGGNIVSKEILNNHHYQTLTALTNKIYNLIRQHQNEVEVRKEMQLLMQLVLQSSPNGIITKEIKQTFLLVAKTFYYRAYYSTQQIENHISKVLFEQVK